MVEKKAENVKLSEKKEEGKSAFAKHRKWEKASGGSKPLMRPGELPVFAACVLLFLFALAYLVKYFSGDSDFSLLGIAIIVLMLSPALPFLATLRARKNPRLLNVNYGYAGFLWLMQLGNVSLMDKIWNFTGTEFFEGLDFWILTSATAIALGTFLLRAHAAQATEESSKS